MNEIFDMAELLLVFKSGNKKYRNYQIQLVFPSSVFFETIDETKDEITKHFYDQLEIVKVFKSSFFKGVDNCWRYALHFRTDFNIFQWAEGNGFEIR